MHVQREQRRGAEGFPLPGPEPLVKVSLGCSACGSCSSSCEESLRRNCATPSVAIACASS